MKKYQENYYMIQLFDKLGNQIVPFGRINYLVLPSPVKPQRLRTSYEDFERNEGAKSFLAYFSYEPNLKQRFCGSIFASNPMKMMAYFDDAFVKSMEVRPEQFGAFSQLDFCLVVNDFEYCDGLIK